MQKSVVTQHGQSIDVSFAKASSDDVDCASGQRVQNALFIHSGDKVKCYLTMITCGLGQAMAIRQLSVARSS